MLGDSQIIRASVKKIRISLKHLALYLLSNAIAVLIFLSTALVIIYISNGGFVDRLTGIASASIGIWIVALILNLPTYAILIAVIKLIKSRAIWLYALAGSFTPAIMVFFTFFVPSECSTLPPYVLFGAIATCLGGLCGAMYGWLDKKWQL